MPRKRILRCAQDDNGQLQREGAELDLAGRDVERGAAREAGARAWLAAGARIHDELASYLDREREVAVAQDDDVRVGLGRHARHVLAVLWVDVVGVRLGVVVPR